jgi:hypothetical protein
MVSENHQGKMKFRKKIKITKEKQTVRHNNWRINKNFKRRDDVA